MKAISIRQPWAWLIVNGHKDIENRTWPTAFRGPVLIHASKGMTNDEYDDVADWLGNHDHDGIGALQIQLPHRKDIERGGIVGKANITGCVSKSDSLWFFGPQGFLIRDAELIPFRPFKGMLGFFNVPDEHEPAPGKGGE